jgi:hypothetical protein
LYAIEFDPQGVRAKILDRIAYTALPYGLRCTTMIESVQEFWIFLSDLSPGVRQVRKISA